MTIIIGRPPVDGGSSEIPEDLTLNSLTTSQLISDLELNVTAPSLELKDAGGDVYATINKGLPSDLITEATLIQNTAYDSLDEIRPNFTADIKLATSVEEAFTVFINGLMSVGHDLVCNTLIDSEARALGLLAPPTSMGGSGTGMFSFIYAESTEQFATMQWNDSNGQIFFLSGMSWVSISKPEPMQQAIWLVKGNTLVTPVTTSNTFLPATTNTFAPVTPEFTSQFEQTTTTPNLVGLRNIGDTKQVQIEITGVARNQSQTSIGEHVFFGIKNATTTEVYSGSFTVQSFGLTFGTEPIVGFSCTAYGVWGANEDILLELGTDFSAGTSGNIIDDLIFSVTEL